LKITFFQKFADIFSTQGAPLVSMTQVENLPPLSMTLATNFATGTSVVNDTAGEFANGVNVTGIKFASCVNDTAPVANNGNNIRLLTPKSELE
jgi:hypothetical protein